MGSFDGAEVCELGIYIYKLYIHKLCVCVQYKSHVISTQHRNIHANGAISLALLSVSFTRDYKTTLSHCKSESEHVN